MLRANQRMAGSGAHSDSVGITAQRRNGGKDDSDCDSFIWSAADVDTAETISALRLARGKNLILTPGIYELTAPIRVTRPHVVVLGLGFATLQP